MFNPKSESPLDKMIASAIAELDAHEVLSKEYGELLDRIARLQKLKETDNKSNFHISPDTIVLAGAQLLGIAMIIRHENLNVITSKALSFVPR